MYAINDTAEQEGIRAGMTLADARAILPSLKTSETDLPAETKTLSYLANWCCRYTPWTATDEEGSGIQFAGGGSIWLDVTGCTHLFDSEDAMMRDIVNCLSNIGFKTHAAIADTPGSAWAAARYKHHKHRRWTIVRKGRAQDILASIPIAGLRLAPEVISDLQAVGLSHIGDLMPIPRSVLADRFGSTVTDRLDQAFGDRPEPISPTVTTSPCHTRINFVEPIGRLEDITNAIHRLTQDLAVMLEDDGLGARHLTLSFYYPDGKVERLQAGTSKASRNADHFTRLLTTKLDRIDATFGIDAITLAATSSEKLSSVQTTLDSPRERSETGIAELADHLSNRLGSENVVQLTLQESHIPERAISVKPAITHIRPVADTCWRPHSSHRNQSIRRPRPLRLLPQPEEVEVVAPIPDDPPVMFRWRKQVFRIEHADGPERITSEWWNDGLGSLETELEKQGSETASEGSVQNNIRDYYRVEDLRGRRFWVYRDGIYSPGTQPQWYVHGVFG
ncbi:MAG: hypothetical protein CFH41_01871 [Alphaproteobacteria bacterium MarineAlpha11_Bin1]|nr:MAG: hypothetical protein CFH41_01871 [Alphaproteobacteria bacterium MarineAlpha11_Bin1]